MRYLHLLLRNLGRRKVRTVFTFLAVVAAFFLFGFLMAVKNGFDAGIQIAGQKRLLTIHKVSIILQLPLRHLEQIRRVPGVAKATPNCWFGGVYVDKKNFFAQIAVEPEDYLEIYPEFVLPPEQKQAFLSTRTGAIAGAKLARRFGWEVALGDQKLTYRELQALARLKAPLVKVRGQWVQLSAEEIQAALDFWKAKGQTMPARQAVHLALGVAQGGGNRKKQLAPRREKRLARYVLSARP